MSAQLLQQLITERAQARPEAAAVLAEDAAPLTYGELDAGSNRLAHMLRELGCRRGDRVVLLKADAAYVPLDTAGPAPRLARMLEVCGCHSILAAGSAAPILREALARATLAQQPLLGCLDAVWTPKLGPRPAP